jgi:hypothetical protein
MLISMAKTTRSFIVGHILLDLGLVGYISGNTWFAYSGFIGSLIFLVRAFIAEERIAKRKKTEDSINN